MSRARLLPLLLLAACQEPFDVDRKTLGPFRIAAVGVVEGQASAAIWSGQGAFHDQPLELRWSLDGQELGTGWELTLPEGDELALEVQAPDGQVHRATVSVAEAPAAFALERGAVQLGEDLSLEARRALQADPVQTTVPAGSAMRLELLPPADLDLTGRSTRWMTAEDQASLLELDSFAADVLAEELVYEDGELVERIPLDPGLALHLALVIDGSGSNRWTWISSAIGVDQALVRHEGLLLPMDADTSTGLVALTLARSEDPWGLRPTAPEPVADLGQQDVLACAPAGEPFRWAWIIEGRCTRDQLEGARVVVEVW